MAIEKWGNWSRKMEDLLMKKKDGDGLRPYDFYDLVRFWQLVKMILSESIILAVKNLESIFHSWSGRFRNLRSYNP